MYAAHFNLREPPFSIAPDPAFLYMSSRHQEALGHLLYGTGQYGGFVQLTGEVGTGKTTIVRTLLAQKLESVDVAMIHNPRQNEIEFVASICDELRVDYPKPASSIKTLVDALNEHLLKTHAAGRRTVVIIDEAQQLDPAVLEQVRLLTNLETDKEKLLRIMLIGQPELAELLARPELRQLASRITARYHLMPLTEAETGQYIIHRLRVAGGAADLFSEAAQRRVHHYSRGVPRLVNIVCDRALLGAYAKNLRAVTPPIVDQAAAEALGTAIPAAQTEGKQRKLPAVFLRWVESVLAVAALVVALAVVYEVLAGRRPATTPVAAAAATPPPAAPAPAATPAPTAAPATAPAAASAPAPVVDSSVDAVRAGNEPLPAVMARLIGLWDPKVQIPPGENVCHALARENLACYHDHGQWSDLGQMNRPAILTLNTAPGRTQYVLLRGLSSDAAVIEAGGTSLRVPLSQLDGVWSGEFLLLWKRENDSTVLGPGSHGPAVGWLRRRLAQAENRPPPQSISESFGPELRDALIRFQHAHGLDADGLAGIRTLIALSDLPRAPGTPTLELSATAENGG